MGELERAREESCYIDYLAKSAKLDLLMIDDFGFMDLDLDKCRDLFEVIDIREGRKALIVISQVPMGEWFNMFARATYAEACLARMTDKRRTYRLEIKGEEHAQGPESRRADRNGRASAIIANTQLKAERLRR